MEEDVLRQKEAVSVTFDTTSVKSKRTLLSVCLSIKVYIINSLRVQWLNAEMALMNYATAKASILRFRAKAMFLRAKSLRPLKVVCCFNSSRGIKSSNLAMHSSANELDTTSTPSKSSRTFSSPCTSGQSCSRTFSPSWRVPRYSPKSLNRKVIIVYYI